MKLTLLYIFFYIYLDTFINCSRPRDLIYVMSESNKEIEITDNLFKIFCFKGLEKHFSRIWNKVFLDVNIDSKSFSLYQGSAPEDVQEAYDQDNILLSLFDIPILKRKEINLYPFNQTCIGIKPLNNILNYKIKFTLITVDYWKILSLIAGLCIFYYGERLSQNNFFYYSSGILIGITASVLIVIFFLSKLFPRKPLMYSFIFGGWSLIIYFYEYIQNLAFQNKKFLLIYIAITSVISFIVCYRFGPVTDLRTKKLIKWTIQGLGLFLIYESSHIKEVTIIIILIIFCEYNIPNSWKLNIKYVWKNRFPSQRKFLSQEEYYQEGLLETTKALEDLRSYCSSPECDTWKTISKLKNPNRFVSFMSGKSHIDDSEDYETDQTDINFTDDEDIDD